MFMFALPSSLNADHTDPPHIYFSPPLDPADSSEGGDYGFTAWPNSRPHYRLATTH